MVRMSRLLLELHTRAILRLFSRFCAPAQRSTREVRCVMCFMKSEGMRPPSNISRPTEQKGLVWLRCMTAE
jgi:hypothetical protein